MFVCSQTVKYWTAQGLIKQIKQADYKYLTFVYTITQWMALFVFPDWLYMMFWKLEKLYNRSRYLKYSHLTKFQQWFELYPNKLQNLINQIRKEELFHKCTNIKKKFKVDATFICVSQISWAVFRRITPSGILVYVRWLTCKMVLSWTKICLKVLLIRQSTTLCVG